MLNFIIDSGNTNIKVFIFRESKQFEFFAAASEKEIIDFLKINNFSKGMRCILSSVRKNNPDFIKFLNDNSDFIEFTKKLNLPIKVAYETPETLGNDRLAAACGASILFPNSNILIIDAGSAITYDIVESSNTFIGGNISPGINFRFKALHEFTYNLPLVNYDLIFDNKLVKKYFAQNTTNGIINGVFNGVVHEIEGVINSAQKQYPDIKIVLTGGDSKYLEKILNFSIFAVADLIAIGLNEILKLNE